MNKVLKLDEQSCSCIVEPGVTYFALYETIQRAGVNLMMDCPDLGGGSLIGNICERGIGFVDISHFQQSYPFTTRPLLTLASPRYTPLGDHFANHCGMEVVLPTGEMVRLGMGALPGKDGEENPTWASYQ
jgi:FAD/FMN-containing dehydrogenase